MRTLLRALRRIGEGQAALTTPWERTAKVARSGETQRTPRTKPSDRRRQDDMERWPGSCGGTARNRRGASARDGADLRGANTDAD